MLLVLFLLGLAVGSFLNVIAFRYDPDRFLFSADVIGAPGGKATRSHCLRCGKTLRWHELLPLISFIAQGGRCRGCRARLSWQYPVVELASGLLFVLAASAVPFELWMTRGFGGLTASYALFVVVFALLLLMSAIDARLRIIPDEINILIALAGLGRIMLETSFFGIGNGTFLPSYALLFGLRETIWLNHAAAAGFGLAFFALLVILTRGRGMGIGDVKLALALGFFFGWPDILFITVFSFIIGSIYGISAILLRKEGMKSAVPFGPFLALGALVVVLWGNAILRWYFSLFGW